MSIKLNPDAIIDKSVEPIKLKESYLVASDSIIYNEEHIRHRRSANGKEIKNDTATIRSIKGNSVVWNQLVDNNTLVSGEKNGVVISKNEDGSITFNGTATSTLMYNLANVKIPVGYKVALTGVDNLPPFIFYLNSGIGAVLTSSGILTCSSKGATGIMFLYFSANTTFDNVTIKPKIHNLTNMFGVDNEPTTIEEFYERIPIGVDINAYNAGEIIDGNYGAIKTVGFNQWDEQWEVGTINGSTGVNSNHTQSIRCVNYIPVLPDIEYYFHIGRTCSLTVCCYDSAYNFLGWIAWGERINIVYKTLPNTSYIRFATYTANGIGYGSIYNNDICINISDDSKNGTYEPYVESTCDLSWIKKYFPNGMRSTRSVYDEITFNQTTYKWETIQRVDVVDLGDLEFVGPLTNSTNQYFRALISKKKYGYHNLLCSRFRTDSGHEGTGVSIGYISGGGTSAYIYVGVENDAYVDATTFKEAMQGVMLNYELAEPIIIAIDDVVDGNYNVYDFGTEKLISSSSSAVFNADIVYQFNAVDRIRNSENNIKSLQKNSLKPEYVHNRICASETVPYDSEIPIYEVDSSMEKDKCGIKGSGKYFTLQITSESINNNNIPTAKAVHDYIENKYSALIVEIEDDTEYKDLF